MRLKHIPLLLFALFSINIYGQMTPTYNDILIPMRDGLFLEADVYVPTGVDSAEVILIQTPYNKNLLSWSLPMGVGMNIDSQPFIWVVVDWRGFYGSFPAFIPQANRGEDGYDVCEWIIAQTWHKDRIGTWGPSALGGVQYSTAKEQHPNHTCAVPIVAHPQQSYDSYFYGGVLEKARLDQLDALGYGLSPLIMANTYYSAVWQFSENSTWYPQDITIPTLQIGGWYDHNIDKMMDWYAATRTSSAPAVQNEQWLLVGPWVHGGTGIAQVGSSIQGELNYPNAELISDTMAWEFLQYYLLDTPNNWQNTDLITYYELGNDVWNTSNGTSIEILTNDILNLSENGQLISMDGAGNSGFISDPYNPSPTIGGPTLYTTLDQGPYDQISLEARTDISTFATDNLPQDVSISGRVKVDLYIESDKPDCDLSVRMVDVYPDGRNMLITDGIARMRFRNGLTQADEAFIIPGTVYNRQIELPFTNYTWLAGHQIKVYIGGNSSYRWDVNLQNGGAMYTAGDTNVANITIYHNPTYPSQITLPGTNQWLGSNELNEVQLSVYPNPVNNKLMIDTDLELDRFEIMDLNGRIMSSDNLNSNVVNTESLISGVYLIRLYSGAQSFEKRFVKF